MKKYFKYVRWHIVLQFIAEFISIVALAWVPYLQKRLIDGVTYKQGLSGSSVLRIIISMTILVLIYCTFTYLASHITIIRINRMKSYIQKDLFTAICHLDVDEFRRHTIGEYISMMNTDVMVVVGDYAQPFLDMIRNMLVVIIYGITMCICIDWKIALFVLISSILIILIPIISKIKLGNLKKEQVQCQGQYTSKLMDYLQGFKLIDHNTVNNIKSQHENSSRNISQAIKQFGTFKAFTTFLFESATKIMEISVFIVIAVMLLNEKITIGTALAIFGYLHCFAEPLQDFLYDINTINSVNKVKQRISHYVSKVGCYGEKCGSRKDISTIELKNISLQYDNFIMKNLCCTFEKGRKYAIVGHSGSGKSTILNIIMGYKMQQGGTVEIDGVVREGSLREYSINCINQHEHIYNANFKDNVTMFGSYGEEAIINVMNQCSGGLAEKIQHKENCTELSGGEKQFLSLMRALASEDDVLLMDEPFSAMDVETYKKAMDIVLNLQDKTIVMVTHNLDENLQRFDQVMLMEHGVMQEHVNAGTVGGLI